MRHSIIGRPARTLLASGIALGVSVCFTTRSAAQTPSYHVVATYQLGGEGGWDYIALDSAHNRLFVARSDRIMVVDPDRGTLLGEIPGFDRAHGIAFSYATGHGFATSGADSTVTMFDLATMKVTRRWSIAPCESPTGLAIDAAHGRLFSVCRNRIMAISDVRAGKLYTTEPIGSGVDGARYDPATGDALASNGEGSLTVVHEVSPDSFQVAQTVPTMSGARTLELDPRNHRVYVVGAKFGEAPAQPTEMNPRRRPPMIPGSFTLLVLAR
jgi:DNA-binding beta-propeller fold protein YncE